MISENKGSENVTEQYRIENDLADDKSDEEAYESAYLNPDCFHDDCISKTEYNQMKTKSQELNEQMLQYRIRKLTPTECYRLMGWKDHDIQKVKDIGMSDTQMFRQAGNGLVINCIELIFEHLYKAQYKEQYKCGDEYY